MIIEWFGRLLRVHKREWSKVLLFTLLGAILQAGIAIGASISDSVFLSRVGSDKLPYVFIFMPVIMMIFIPLYNSSISKYGTDKIFSVSMLAISVGSGLIFALFLLGIESLDDTVQLVLYFFVKIWPFAILLALSTLFWIMIEGYFDIIDAKRLFSFFNGGLAAGAALGGTFVTGFSDVIGIGPMFLAWSILGIMCIPIANIIRRKWRRIEDTDVSEERSQIKVVYGAIKKSKYVKMVNFSILALFFITTLTEYQYMDILSQNRSEQELASLFGVLFAFANVFNLIVNFFLFNRMVSFIGVRNVALIQPFIYCITFVWLIFDRSYSAAIFAFFAYQGFMTAIELNNVNFIFNAVSSDVRRQVRSFAEGLGDPIATAFAGVLLLFTLGTKGSETLSIIGLLFSILYLVFVLSMRAKYRISLLESLRKDWLDFSKMPEEYFKMISENEIVKEIDSVDLPNQILILETLALKNPIFTIKELLKLLEKYSSYEQKYLSTVLGLILKSGDTNVLREVIIWFHNKEHILDDSVYETLAASGLLLPSSCNGRIIPELVSGLVSRRPSGNAYALKKIEQMSLGDENELEAALRAIGLGGNNRHAWWAATFCSHASESVRIRAAEAVALLANKGDGSLAGFLFPMLKGSEMERMKALSALAVIGDVGMISGLLDASKNLSPRERRTVASIVSTIGIHSVPALVKILKSEDYSLSSRGIAARALSQVSWPQFEQIAPSLIEAEVYSAYRAVAWQMVIEKQRTDCSATRVLSLCKRTEAKRKILFVLELLALIGSVGDIDLVSASLQSNNARQRANAIESLEQDIPRKIFKRILPLIDNRDDHERLLAGKRLYRITIPNDEEVISTALDSNESLLKAAALHLVSQSDNEHMVQYGIKLLQEHNDKVVRDTLRILVNRKNDNQKQNALTPVERVDLLSRSEIFRNLGVEDILEIALTALDGSGIEAIGSEYCFINNYDDPVVKGIEILWDQEVSGDRPDSIPPDVLLAMEKDSIMQIASVRTGIATRLLALAGGAA